MPNPAVSEFVDFATGLADEARRITQRYFRQPQEISSKSDGTPVTIADLEIEQKARSMIAAHYPGHGVYGEEEGEENEEEEGNNEGRGREERQRRRRRRLRK